MPASPLLHMTHLQHFQPLHHLHTNHTTITATATASTITAAKKMPLRVNKRLVYFVEGCNFVGTQLPRHLRTKHTEEQAGKLRAYTKATSATDLQTNDWGNYRKMKWCPFPGCFQLSSYIAIHLVSHGVQRCSCQQRKLLKEARLFVDNERQNIDLHAPSSPPPSQIPT